MAFNKSFSVFSESFSVFSVFTVFSVCFFSVASF